MAGQQPLQSRFPLASPPAQPSMRATRAGVAACGMLAALLSLLLTLSAPPASALAQDVAPAGTDAPAAHTLFVTATQDTYVDSTAPASNFGSSEALTVSIAAGVPIQSQAWFRFDVSDFPFSTNIHTATLHLHQTAASGATSVMQLGAPQAAWTESTLTWNNRPAVTAFSSMQTLATSPLAVEVDITTRAQLWVNSDAADNLGISLATTPTTPSSRTFDSREVVTPTMRPRLELNYTLPPVRVCIDQNDTCPPAANAQVHNITRNQVYTTSVTGLILPADMEQIALGDVLWARYPVETENGATRYFTMANPVRVEREAYMFVSDSTEMRVIVSDDNPLLLQDLDISAQWFVEGGPPADAALFVRRIIGASNFLYSFTDGQFALGTVNVYQSYDQWEDANIQLYANNTLRPRAIIGGIVVTDTPDFNPAIPLTYTPGVVSIGSYWNRFGTPPNSDNVSGGVPFTEADLQTDWSIALAHELGHYLLYLFDTYTGIDGNSDAALALLCTGTAMGDAYLPTNHGFIADATQWNANCAGTQAFDRQQGRTEWATIQGWYDWAVVPTAFVPGPAAPPLPLTTVNFIAPSTEPNGAAAQIFDLDYQDGESSSGEARAFLLRNDRVLEQGKPPKDSLQVQLTGAELGDTLCVYDINDHAEGEETPRHQFGCEIIVPNDSTLVLTKDPAWSPEIAATQIGPNQLRIVMTETIAGPAGEAVFVRLFPEHEQGLAPLAMPRVGNAYVLDITLPGPVEPLYAQVFVGENPAAPLTRREVIVDRGTGGGGAYGPARHYGDILVVSSDGNASFDQEGDVELLPGQSIAWQSMPGTPPLPFLQRIIGQSYRLDAFPSELVEDGTVSIRFEDPQTTAAANGSEASASAIAGGSDAALWFWNGAEWRELPTTTITPAGATDGILLASAESQGVGVYAVLVDAQAGSTRFLPVIAR